MKSFYEGEDVLVKNPWEINSIDGYSGAFCECGHVLHIKTPKVKSWYRIKCPKCGFIVQLFCGEEGNKLSMDDIRGLIQYYGVKGD